MCYSRQVRLPRAAPGRGLTLALSCGPQSSLPQTKKQACLPPPPLPSGELIVEQGRSQTRGQKPKALTAGDAETGVGGVKQSPDTC